jgi:hypothetical protein
MDMDAYIASRSAVVQRVLEASGEFSDEELAAIRRLNDPAVCAAVAVPRRNRDQHSRITTSVSSPDG